MKFGFRSLVFIVAELAITLSFPVVLYGQQSSGTQPSDNMPLPGLWSMRIDLSPEEFAAMEPAAPQFQGFGPPPGFVPPPAGGPPTDVAQQQAEREEVANLFGTQFPWVNGALQIETAGTVQSFRCRLRYDGDFTYMMSAAGPKRPLFVELLEEATFNGSSAFRLHTLIFDPTKLRERTAAHLFKLLKVPVTEVVHAEVHLTRGVGEPQLLGLYTALEVVNSNFLSRQHISPEALVAQINGLGTIQDLGSEWTAYAPLFRTTRTPSSEERRRIVEFARLIGSASDEDFAARLGEFIDVESLLRYVAANSITSNLTGFSNLGANDFLCLDGTTNRFHLITSELETAFGGSALSGTPEQLANLSLTHPYAGECKLVERTLKIAKYKEAYFGVVRDVLNSGFGSEDMKTFIAAIETATADARDRDTKAAEERARQAAAAFGGGFGGGAPGMPAPMTPYTFVEKRLESIASQLSGNNQGYIPAPPSFGGGGGGFGPPRQQGAPGPITDAQFRESVQVPPAFSATLYAKSPEVNYPVAISAEPTQAIYIASDEQGSLGTDRDGGKILKCMDSDGDGKVDSVTTFCRVDHVRGVLYRDGKVWVCHPPFLSVFQDDDGDGIADRNQQLVSGLTTEMVNTRGGDHTTNGIRMGIDGWIYIGDGDYGVPEARGIDGSTVVLRGGGILRVRPDGTELELFCSGQRNPFDIAIDPQLNMFTRDNTNDGGGWDTRVSQLFQSAEYGYPRLFANFSDEIMPTLGVFGGGGGTGGLYIEDDGWPEPFNQSLFTGDWGRSAVFHHPLNSNGPTFDLSQAAFATIPRATGMDIDAQGNLYVASWWSGEASVYVGPHVGFVTRIAPANSTRQEFPRLSDATLDELIELMRAPQAVVRFHAQGELIKRGKNPGMISALTSVVTDSRFPLDGRIACLFAIKEIAGPRSHPIIVEFMSDRDLREFAIRALVDRKSQLTGVTPQLIVRYLNDESSRVRAQVLIGLGRIGDSSIAELLIPQADVDGNVRPDPAQPNASLVLPHLAMRALLQLNAVDACLQAIEGEHWRGALRVLRNMHTPEAVDGLIAKLHSIRGLERRNEILAALIRLYQQETPYDGSWWGIRPDTTGPYYDAMNWEKSDEIKSLLITAITESDSETLQRLQLELQRHQVSLPGVALMNSSNRIESSEPIVIAPVDPNNPNQVGNMEYAQAIAKSLASTGSVEAGAILFKSRSCNACHTATAGQKPVGPHLADIGKRYKAEELLESMLKPSAKIAQGYETQQILLDSGTVISGFVVGENGRQIFLRDSQGKTHAIDREEIEQRARQQISAMPEGLASSLEPQQLADLIAYLQSL